MIQYYITNMSALFMLGLTGCYITFISGSMNYFKTLYTLCIVTGVTWLGHYLMHNHNKYNPIAKIHKITHHSAVADTFLGKLIEYSIIEFFFFGGGILLLFTILFYRNYKLWVFDPYILLFWSMFVPILHELYYHMFELSDYHELHHAHTDKLYSPEIWDILFNTKLANSPVDNENKIIPFMVLFAIMLTPIIRSNLDPIKYFSK